MNRKMFRWQPEFESMEAIVLLSAVTLAGRPGAAAVAELEAKRHSILLSGTVNGTYYSRGGAGAVETFFAHGSISPLGEVTLKGSIRRTNLKGSGSVTISAKHGRVFAKLGAHALGTPVFYKVTGGTGKWANVSGTGEALITIVLPYRGILTITFTAAAAPSSRR
jgi:hypothetical protein